MPLCYRAFVSRGRIEAIAVVRAICGKRPAALNAPNAGCPYGLASGSMFVGLIAGKGLPQASTMAEKTFKAVKDAISKLGLKAPYKVISRSKS